MKVAKQEKQIVLQKSLVRQSKKNTRCACTCRNSHRCFHIQTELTLHLNDALSYAVRIGLNGLLIYTFREI